MIDPRTVAHRAGLPPAAAPRLRGASKHALMADARRLRDEMGLGDPDPALNGEELLDAVSEALGIGHKRKLGL